MALFGPIGGGGLFSPFGQQQQQPVFRPVSISPALLQQSFNADLLALSSQALRTIDRETGPQVSQTPFNEQDDRPLATRTAEIERSNSLFDARDPIVRDAADEPEAQTTFLLFNALSDLQTLAEAASEEGVSDVRRADLDERFQAGLEEIRTFVNDLELPNLFFQTGERSPGVTSDVEIGRSSFTVSGDVIQRGERDAPISGLTGTETFTIRFDRTEGTTDVAIDLSGISGPITVDALADFLNEQITAIPQLDELGDPVLDDDGNPVPRFVSRFSVFEDADGNFGLQISGSPFEAVQLIPSDPTPTLLLAGTVSPLTGDGATIGQITEVKGLDATLEAGRSFDLAGADPFGTAADQATVEPRDDPFGFLEGFTFPSERDGTGERQAETIINDIAVDSEGFIYAVGTTRGDLDQGINVSEGGDLFLTKFDSRGREIYSRFLGTSATAEGTRVAVDANDDVIVVGRSSEEGGDGDVFSGFDSVVRKFAGTDGEQIFSRQFDSFGEDGVEQLTLGPNGEIFLGGSGAGAITGTTALGQDDALLTEIDPATGDIVQRVRVGTAADDRVAGLAIASDGNILVLSEQNGQAVLERRDPADLSTVTASLSLGALTSTGSLSGLTVDGNNLYVTGAVSGGGFTGGAATVANPADGNNDGFVLRLTDTGASFTSDAIAFIGSTGTDRIDDLVVSGGDIFVAGSAAGEVEGGSREGATDAFVARLDASSLAVESVEQVGESLTRRTGTALAFTPFGDSSVDSLGFPLGTLVQPQDESIVSRTGVRPGDSFFITIGSRRTRIDIDVGDTLATLARRIDLLDFRRIEASVQPGSNNLRIGALQGARIQIEAGPEGRDALSRLGITPTTVYGTDILFGLGEDEDEEDSREIGGAFALNINQDFRLTDRASAQFTFAQLDNAISTVQRAFRSLTPNQTLEALERQQQIGPPPPGSQARLQELRSALARLQGSNFAGPSSLIV